MKIRIRIPRLRAVVDAVFTSIFSPVPRSRSQLGAVDLGETVALELRRIGGEVKAGLAALDTEQTRLQARLADVEQKAARKGAPAGLSSDHVDAELRALIESSSELAAVADGKSRRAVLELPTGFFATITSTGGLALPDRQPGLVEPPRRRFTIRSLLPSIPTTSGSVQYTQETGYTNNAAPVTEGSLKPESTITFALQTANVATIAHWVKTTVQVLADTPLLQQYLSNRLRYGLAYVEDLQLLKGSGIGANLRGLMLDATAYSRTTSGDTKIDVLRRAVTQLELSDFQATGIVLNPGDWEAIALTKDGEGRYIAGSPGGPNPATLWDLPVVSTAAMTAGSFLVADFPQSALVLDREQARVDISTEDQDNFITNRCTIRGEERIGLAILRPGGLIKGTFS